MKSLYLYLFLATIFNTEVLALNNFVVEDYHISRDGLRRRKMSTYEYYSPPPYEDLSAKPYDPKSKNKDEKNADLEALKSQRIWAA